MGNNDEADVKRQDNTGDFLEDNKSEFAGFLRLEEGIATINGQRADLAQQIKLQAAKTNGVTAQTLASFANMGAITFKLVSTALVWAQDVNNVELITLFSFSLTSFLAQSKQKSITQAKTMVDAIEANAQALLAYNITAANIQAMKDSIAVSESSINATRKGINTRSTAQKAMKSLIKSVNTGYDKIQVLIVNEYTDTKPNFVNGFLSSWRKDVKGIRHTGLSAVITNAATGKAIENATLAIEGTSKTATTNMAGLAEIIKMKSGSFHISISADGYTTLLQDVTVPKGKTLELAIALVLA